MDNIFIIRVILSFFIAGGWIAMSSIVAEKFGSKIGGLISNLPSNILISLIFISIVNDVGYLKGLVPAIPIGMLIDTVFLLVFIILLRYNLVLSIVVSLILWFCMAFFMARFEYKNLWLNILFYAIITSFSVWFIEKIVKVQSKQNNKKKFSFGQIAFRTAFGGIIVASIVVISKFCSPYFTGIFSTFPAMLLSTLIILTINQSKEFAMATGKVLVLSTSNIIVYALMVSFTYPKIGIFFGTILSYLISAVWVLLLHPVVKRMS